MNFPTSFTSLVTLLSRPRGISWDFMILDYIIFLHLLPCYSVVCNQNEWQIPASMKLVLWKSNSLDLYRTVNTYIIKKFQTWSQLDPQRTLVLYAVPNSCYNILIIYSPF